MARGTPKIQSSVFGVIWPCMGNSLHRLRWNLAWIAPQIYSCTPNLALIS